jgi:hypothetical protein
MAPAAPTAPTPTAVLHCLYAYPPSYLNLLIAIHFNHACDCCYCGKEKLPQYGNLNLTIGAILAFYRRQGEKRNAFLWANAHVLEMQVVPLQTRI